MSGLISIITVEKLKGGYKPDVSVSALKISHP